MACADLKCQMLPQRVIMAIMGFLAVVVGFTMRACLSVAITEMVAPITNTKNDSKSTVCDAFYTVKVGDHYNETHAEELRYHWTQEQQGWILSSFYIGYAITHIPGGLLAEKFGGKWTLSIGILITTICTVLTPQTLRFDERNALVLLISLRIIMGLAGGPLFPSLTVLLAAWVPEKERGKLGGFVMGGSQIGSVLSFYISGIILTNWPWPIVFYFWSFVSIIWFIVFTIICYSNPGSHPFISKSELDYLKAEMGQIKRQKNLPSTPWKLILTNVPVLALTFAQLGHDWLFYIMASDLPKYMKEVLGFPVQEVGLYSSLPYLLMFTVSIVSGFFSDYLINVGYLTISQARKIFTAFASVFPSTLILVASYAGCNRLLVVLSFILAMGFMGNFYPSMKVNPIDLSPNYAGSLMALTNGLGAFTGIAGPAFVGILTPDSSLEQWRFVFWVTFGIAMVRTIVYSIWSSAEVQPFNDPRSITTTECEELAKSTKIKESAY